MKIKSIALSQDLSNIFSLRGLSNTPSGVDIHYFGFNVELKPAEFLSLVEQTGNDDFFEKQLKAGHKIAYPSFKVDKVVDGDDISWRITDHEGRHRMMTLAKMYGPDILVPVLILPYGVRNRSLDKTRMTETFVSENGKNSIVVKRQRIHYNNENLIE